MEKIKNSHYLIIIGFFSFFLNYYYSTLGVFPIDTFLHYDSAYKILNSDYPIRDYWIVSGFFVDFFQAFFFKIFGVNWNAYIIHSSFINLIASILVFKIFQNYKLSKKSSFIYSVSFSFLAYTISGTPFVDLHAIYLCFIAFYLIVDNILNNRFSFFSWSLVSIIYFVAFLSKQVPSLYLILINIFFLTLFFIYKKKIKLIIFIIIFSLVLILFFLIFLKLLNIGITEFYIQYINYPSSIGINRFKNFNFSFESLFNKYKFILLPISFLIAIKINKLRKDKSSFTKKENIIFYIFVSMVFVLFAHQLLTKNQIYIYFLIPLCFGFLEVELAKIKFNYKKIVNFILLILVMIITTQYHLRYNVQRKFHELENTDLSKSINASLISKDLKNLRWLNPFYKDGPVEEINLLSNVIKAIEKNELEVALITNYIFLDSVTKKNINYFNKTFTLDGASMPLENSKYFNYYVKFLYQKILNKKIQKIYFINKENLNQELLTNYVDEKCYYQEKDDIFTVYKIKVDCIARELKTFNRF